MSEQHGLLADSTGRLFAELVASRHEALDSRSELERRWRPFAEMGLQSLLVAEDRGGFGGGGADAWLVFRLAGLHGVDLPVVEAILAADILGAANLEIPAGLLSVAASAEGRLEKLGGRVRFTGHLRGVPWGRFSDSIVAMIETEEGRHAVCVQTKGAAERTERVNAAGEPRDDIRFEDAPGTAGPRGAQSLRMLSMGALARAAQIAGACRSALTLSLTHVADRQQFGRPISKFQTIQHALASLAEQVQAAESASRAAFDSLARGGGELEIGSAKIVANMAAEQAVAIAHQVHGAIGFTWEYDLHHATRRLLAWGTEFGNLSHWNGVVGSLAAAQGPHGLWPLVADR